MISQKLTREDKSSPLTPFLGLPKARITRTQSAGKHRPANGVSLALHTAAEAFSPPTGAHRVAATARLVIKQPARSATQVLLAHSGPKDLFLFFLEICLYGYMPPCMCAYHVFAWWPIKPEEGAESLGNRVTARSHPLGAGKGTWVLGKSSEHSHRLICLSSS